MVAEHLQFAICGLLRFLNPQPFAESLTDLPGEGGRLRGRMGDLFGQTGKPALERLDGVVAIEKRVANRE